MHNNGIFNTTNDGILQNCSILRIEYLFQRHNNHQWDKNQNG